MLTKCSMCEGSHEAKEVFTQATRWEPMESLGWQYYCPTWQCYAKADTRVGGDNDGTDDTEPAT